MRRQNKNPVKVIRRHPKKTAAIVIAGIIAGFLAFHGGQTDKSASSGGKAPARSSSQPSSPTKTSGTSNSVGQGGAVDKKGKAAPKTPQSQWTISASGQITLHSPAAGATLRSGNTISGTAKIATVQYRLVDDNVGVIAQGQLSVVNGKFSGALEFKPQANTGHLDIFSYNQKGAEINSIEIAVKLGS